MGLLAGAATLPGAARAQSRDGVLVIGMDISDAITYDTALGTAYSPPVVYEACYDTLVTMVPGDYTTIHPALATSWAKTPDGKGWRFTLRDGVKFNTGNPLTVEDVKFSFDRVFNMHGQAVLYLDNVADTRIAGPNQFDILLKDPAQSVLDILCCPSFSVWDRKVLQEHGGVATADAATTDKAKEWLNQHSCGTGAYNLMGWQRNSIVQLERNPNYWRGPAAFQRVVIRHMPEAATQLLAIQRGDIDVAFNLIPEQISTVKQTKGLRIEELASLDQIYIALTTNPEFNKALAVREARQAIGWAIDYEGIKNNLLGGSARLPATILPIGTLGSTPEVAKQIGFHQDFDRAKAALAKAGLPEGFSFKLSYPNSVIAGVPYAVLAQKMQSDLAHVGIKAELDPLEMLTLRTQYNAGNSTCVIQYWNPAAVSNLLWGAATIQRLATRMHFKPPQDIVDLVNKAADASDQQQAADLWIQYQKRMVEEAFLLNLFQPTYQIAVRDKVKTFPLTAAGWLLEVRGAA